MLSYGSKGNPNPSLAHGRLVRTDLKTSATGETRLEAGKIPLEHEGHTYPAGAVFMGYCLQYVSRHFI